MQPVTETKQTLSIERKLKLHEARESIIGRLAANLPTSISLDSFLKVIVSELGRMMEVDRCDIIKLTPEGELRVSHEWRGCGGVRSRAGARLPAGAARRGGRLTMCPRVWTRASRLTPRRCRRTWISKSQSGSMTLHPLSWITRCASL